MIAAIAGLIGIVLCLFVADAWEKGQGGRLALILTIVLVCFGISIFGVAIRPDYLLSCDRYSRFADTC